MIAWIGIFRKEMRVALTTPVVYVVGFFFVLIGSLLFWLRLLQFEQATLNYRHYEDPKLVAYLNFNDVIINYLFVNMQIIFVFLIPLLTMRVFAEEKKQKTLEVLLTSPIRPWQILLGKYVSVLTWVLFLCALAMIYPALLDFFGSTTLINGPVIDWMATWMGVAGLFLTAAAFGSIGLFFSSVTENQLVAALLSFTLLLFLWFLHTAGMQTQGWFGDVLSYISPLSHMSNFSRGSLYLPDLVYFVSICVLFLFLTHRVLESERWI